MEINGMKRVCDIYYWKHTRFCTDARVQPCLALLDQTHKQVCRVTVSRDDLRNYSSLDVETSELLGEDALNDLCLDYLYYEFSVNVDKYITQYTVAMLGDHAHTSMSVGDVIKLDDTWYAVAFIGWTKLS